jgi:hypothetical protein
MRSGFYQEHWRLVGLVGFVSFCCVDEEPIFDFSDLNLVHVWALVAAACIIYFDLLLRSRNGQ